MSPMPPMVTCAFSGYMQMICGAIVTFDDTDTEGYAYSM